MSETSHSHSHSSDHSHADPDSPESMSRSALVWLFGAGTFALALSTLLYVTDYRLSHSTRETDLRDRLHELRTAQASMKSNVTDERQLDMESIQGGSER